jgi:hypothetical protein
LIVELAACTTAVQFEVRTVFLATEGTFSLSAASIGRLTPDGAVLFSFAFDEDRKFPEAAGSLLRNPNLSLIFYRFLKEIFENK